MKSTMDCHKNVCCRMLFEIIHLEVFSVFRLGFVSSDFDVNDKIPFRDLVFNKIEFCG